MEIVHPYLNSFIVLALIPLILSIGITPAISFGDMIDSPRKQMANGVSAEDVICKSGLALMIRTSGDAVCVKPTSAEKLIISGFGTIEKEASMMKETEEMMEEPALETFETRIGTLTLDADYLTPESAALLSDELFFQRAIQVYQLALPAMGGAGIFYEQDKVGATVGDVIYWSDFMTSDIDLLTGNTSVLYFFSLQDLSNGPIVVNVPAGNLQGHLDNIYQQVITDYGIVGPNEGNEASFLILPPNYDGEIPPNYDGETENYFVEQSDTMQFIVVGRAFVNAPDKAAAEELIKSLNIYNLSEVDNSPQVQFFDVSGESLKLSHPTTEGFWEFLHQVYSKEPVVRPEDKNLVGLMHAIGIVPGEPFAPDEHSKALLDEAAVVANLMSRNVAYDSPVKESFLYWPEKNWELAFMTKNPQFEDERGVTQIEPRLSFVYQAITTADAMVLEIVGKGSKYVGTYRDADENFLDGSNTYHLNIPADVPAENFWSIVVYDAETRSMIKNGVQPLPAIRSLDSDKFIQNDDGSYDVYFGPEAPEGYENNWVKTNEGDGFFVFMRFYSPTEAYFDKSWQLPMVKKIEERMEESTPEIFETRVGSLELQSDYPTPETQKLLKDELFFQRAIQVYHLTYPALGNAGIFYEQDKVGITTGDVVYWSDFMTSSAELLTANVSVLYLISQQDLSDGPIVVAEPAGTMLGHIDNLYQQPITDIGIPGPNKGEGGLTVILPPNYDGDIPEGYTAYQSDTMQITVLARSFVIDGDKDAAEKVLHELNIYKLSESDNPPQAKFFDLAGVTIKMAHPTTEGFWEFLHQVYSKEPVVRDEDKNLVGLMHAIGIVPGEPFEPDEHSKALLDEAAIVADLMTKGVAYDNPAKEPYIFYPGKNWENPFMTKNADFEDERGATLIENRLGYVYQAITVADAMILKLEGKGSKYLVTYRDADENFLGGSNTYLLNIPANPPAERFWSLVAYDAETRSMIVNDERPRPGFGSVYVEHYTQNSDGSYDVYVGPEAPEGYENNWIKTNEGDGFFLMFRFYSPTEAYYDKSWQLPNIELVK